MHSSKFLAICLLGVGKGVWYKTRAGQNEEWLYLAPQLGKWRRQLSHLVWCPLGTRVRIFRSVGSYSFFPICFWLAAVGMHGGREPQSIHISHVWLSQICNHLDNFSVDCDIFEIVSDVAGLQNGDSNQGIRRRPKFGRAAMKELENDSKGCWERPWPRSSPTFFYLRSPCLCESGTVKKPDNKNCDSFFVLWSWRGALWIPWSVRKTNKWILERIKLGLSFPE